MLNSLVVKSMIKKEIETEGIPDTEARKEIGDHTGNTNNPHKVTKVQVGLEKVDNTSDVDKPVSTEQQKAIDSAKNNANEYTDQKIADLINGAPTTLDTLKEIADAMEENQDVVKALDESIGTKANTSDLTAHTGNTNNPHKVTKVQVGLEKVDNTSDVDKPVSTEQQKAIDSAKNNANEYTDQKIADLINGAPTTLDTLKEIADAMEENQDVVKALDESIGTKANSSDLADHIGNTSNPHNVTAEQTPYDPTESGLSAQNVQNAVDEVNTDIQKSNDCLSYYGLKNEYIGDFEQGYYIDVSENGTIMSSQNQKYDKTHYACAIGDKVKIITDKRSWIGIAFYKSDGTFISGNEATNTKEIISTTPTESSYFMYYINRDAIVKTIYINNAIDEVNEKVGQNGCGEIAGGKNLTNVRSFSNSTTDTLTYFSLRVMAILNGNEDFPVNISSLVIDSTGKYSLTLDCTEKTFDYLRVKHNGKNLDIEILHLYTNKKAVYTLSFNCTGYNPSVIDGLVLDNIQIEEGSTATPYEPYYPSNKMLSENKADKSEVTTNLLKPKLGTTTQNGVTCTNNGDGTYTLNGTATEDAIFIFAGTDNTLATFKGHSSLKLVGFPKKYASAGALQVWRQQNELIMRDRGDGVIITGSDMPYGSCNMAFVIYKGAVTDGMIIKPMVTTDLSATYDDFVPYTGTTGKLNGDVAELEKSNEGKMDKANPTGTGAFSMNRKVNTTVGEKSTAEGNDCTASGNYSHAEGLETNATQERAHAEGYGTNASGYQAHTEGHWTVASGQSSHAEGESTLARGYETHAEGNGTKAIGNFCHVEGHNTTALSDASHSEGSSTNRAPDSITSSSTNGDIISSWNSSKFSLAKGTHSHVEGCDCLALGDGSHAEGVRTKATGDMSHSGGYSTEATGRSSCAIGEMVSARYDYQTAIGILNHNKEENIFEVGNGISDSTGIEKSNALELTRTGDLAIAGNFYFTDANGNKISMRDILTRLVALEPGFSVDVEG